MQNEQQFIETAAKSYALETSKNEHRGLDSIKEDFIAGVVFWGNRTVDLIKSISPGIQELATERQKQIDKHGFTAEHHINHPEWYNEGQLIYAANAISQHVDSESHPATPKNWDDKWFRNLCDRSLNERLIIAGALIAAELDRINAIERK